MELIKKEGGYALFKVEEELHFVDFKSTGLYTSIFVFGLIALITLLNVVIQLFMGKPMAMSAILIPGLICFFLWRKQKKKRAILEREQTNSNPTLIIDTITREVFSGDRKLLGHLDDCRFSYDFQIMSSASKLMLHHSQGKQLIAKGNPFGGSRRPFNKQLKNYNLMNV